MGCGASAKKYEAGGGASQDTPKTKGTEGLSKAECKQANNDYQQAMQFLLKAPLLKRLPKDQHPMLAAACERVTFEPGGVIFKQGDAGSEFFLIMEGAASVCVAAPGAAPAQVATLRAGDYFGEKALIAKESRTATITATAPMKCLKITRDNFLAQGLNEKLAFANRKAVGGGGKAITAKAKPPDPKTSNERQLVMQALNSNPNLTTMVTLDASRMNAMVEVAWKEHVAGGTEIIREGDIQADFFYIVQAGSFEIRVTEESEDGRSTGESNVVSLVGPGGSFGELALLYLVPRAATIVALEDSIVWVIDRGNFKSILMKSTDAKLATYTGLLDTVSVLAPLTREEKKEIAQALVEMHFVKDEIVVKQGDPGSTFYILYDGEVKVDKDGATLTTLRASTGSNTEMFGERALLNNEARAATVTVISQTAKVLALDRDSFNALLGPLEDIITESQKGARTGKKGVKQAAASNIPLKVRLQDLTKIGLLGCGGFGAVELWECKVTKETYALKNLSKGYIVRTGMQDSVINEKDILLMTNSPFIIKMYATYNTSQTMSFLLEPALGGELYATYSRKGLHGSEKHARFYMAGTVLAFEHCHERHIIYRDLKPENLLFTDKGHIKLTDMGLAKFVIGKTFTTCGTPDYFAPEIIQSAGHTKAVDWWTLGVLLFELLTGHPPFESPFPMQIYGKVLKGIDRVQFPQGCHGASESLVRALLQKDPSERLPMRPGGTNNINTHPWFKIAAFNWEAMQKMTLPPPYVPVVRSKTDVANFCARKEDMPRVIEYKDDGSGWDAGFATA